jgi:hypothetical protein
MMQRRSDNRKRGATRGTATVLLLGEEAPRKPRGGGFSSLDRWEHRGLGSHKQLLLLRVSLTMAQPLRG